VFLTNVAMLLCNLKRKCGQLLKWAHSPKKHFETRGRCNDHNFRRFLPIFGENIGVFLKSYVYLIKFLHNLALFYVKNADFFRRFFGENIFKIITSVRIRQLPDTKLTFYEHAHNNNCMEVELLCRAARFFLLKRTKMGKNIPNNQKI
jgi:hypothetical protein